MALHDIVHAAANPLSARLPGSTPKAKRVIFLFMQGGPSQQDLFDPKSYIAGKNGQTIQSPLSENLLQVGTTKFLSLGSM